MSEVPIINSTASAPQRRVRRPARSMAPPTISMVTVVYAVSIGKGIPWPRTTPAKLPTPPASLVRPWAMRTIPRINRRTSAASPGACGIRDSLAFTSQPPVVGPTVSPRAGEVAMLDSEQKVLFVAILAYELDCVNILFMKTKSTQELTNVAEVHSAPALNCILLRPSYRWQAGHSLKLPHL